MGSENWEARKGSFALVFSSTSSISMITLGLPAASTDTRLTPFLYVAFCVRGYRFLNQAGARGYPQTFMLITMPRLDYLPSENFEFSSVVVWKLLSLSFIIIYLISAFPIMLNS